MRVVRFTDVDPQRVEQLMSEIDASAGPPEGTTTTGLQIVVDADQRTAVVLQFFDSAEDMRDSEACSSVSSSPVARATLATSPGNSRCR